MSHEFTSEQVAKYWQRVDTSPRDDGCWRWTGATSYQKAANLSLGGGRSIRAIRMAYLLEHGDIPDGKVIVQTCNHHWCVNPDHLRPMNKMNVWKDGATRKRQQPFG